MSNTQGSQSNSVDGQAGRRKLECTRSLLLPSGLPHPFCSEAAQALFILVIISDRFAGQTTPYFLRRGMVGGSFVPFRAAIECKSGSQKEEGATRKFAPRIVRGIFEGCHRHSGGLSGAGYLVSDDPLNSAKAGHHIHLRRIRELVLLVGGEFVFQASSEVFFQNMGTSCRERRSA